MKKIVCLFVCLFAGSANASVIIDVTDGGGDVVFDISGSLDMTGANSLSGGSQSNGLISGGSNWYIATGDITTHNRWEFVSVDVPFGTDNSFNTSYSQATGDTFGIWGASGGTPQLLLGTNYLSGDSINSLLTYSSTTFSGLGLISGTYRFEIPNDYVELRIGQAGGGSVPEPASLALITLGLAGISFSRRKKAA